MRSFTITFFVMLTLSLTSCATLSEDECLAMDWALIGFEDGAEGFPPQRIGQHREACAKFGVTPNTQAYRRGRDDGLREYCRPANAYSVGMDGKEYKGVCPSSMADAFSDAYEDGRHLHQLKETVQHTNSEITTDESRLDKNERSLVKLEEKLVNGNNTTEERQNLVVANRELAEEIGHLRHHLRDLQVRLAREEYELALYRNTHHNSY